MDEMLDRHLRGHFDVAGHHCTSVDAAGFKGKFNGILLAAAEGRFDALVTLDKGIEYQNNFTGRKISVVVLRVFKNRRKFIIPHIPAAIEALRTIKPGEVVYVGEPRLVAKHFKSKPYYK